MKKISAILLFSWCILLLFSCPNDHDTSYATVTVYNQSDFDITEFVIFGGEIDVLETGKEHTFAVEWSPGGAVSLQATYYMNGEYFDVDNMEGALYFEGGQHYYSPFHMKDGAKGFVYIKNEGYKVEIEGGEYRIAPETPGSPGQ
jgi:hypothetical protein